MKNIFSRFGIVLLSLMFITTHNSLAATNSKNLTIFAEPNMVFVMTKIAQLYSKKSNVIISVNFAPASESIYNIELGEPADIFISAHPTWIKTLTQKGLADVYNIGYIAGDELVLVTSTSNSRIPPSLMQSNMSLKDSVRILDENKATLILDYEGNSSGKFSNDFITKGSFENLKLFKKLPEDRSPILNIVGRDDNQYALLLASQVKEDSNFRILSSSTNQNIYYQALVIAGDHMTTAREFLQFLKSDEAKDVFQTHGFNVDL